MDIFRVSKKTLEKKLNLLKSYFLFLSEFVLFILFIFAFLDLTGNAVFLYLKSSKKKLQSILSRIFVYFINFMMLCFTSFPIIFW